MHEIVQTFHRSIYENEKKKKNGFIVAIVTFLWLTITKFQEE